MKIAEGMREKYTQWKAKNSDPYGGACFLFAEAWADAIEKRLESGATLADVAKECANEVDRRPGFGISGFMYGMAVSILSKAWVHGDALRRWHNLDTQIRDEGERANESGGTLNPALLSVRT